VFNPLTGADGHIQHLTQPTADVTETDFDGIAAKAQQQVLDGDGGVYHTEEAALLRMDTDSTNRRPQVKSQARSW
jgi:hypothetical protein